MTKDFKRKKKTAVIGGGVMGALFLDVITREGFSDEVCVCEHNSSKRSILEQAFPKIVVTGSMSDVEDAGVILLAVKPQDFSSLKCAVKAIPK